MRFHLKCHGICIWKISAFQKQSWSRTTRAKRGLAQCFRQNKSINSFSWAVGLDLTSVPLTINHFRSASFLSSVKPRLYLLVATLQHKWWKEEIKWGRNKTTSKIFMETVPPKRRKSHKFDGGAAVKSRINLWFGCSFHWNQDTIHDNMFPQELLRWLLISKGFSAHRHANTGSAVFLLKNLITR